MKIAFSQNWNKKLDCHIFSTIRLESSKYAVGNKYEMELNGVILGIAVVIDIRVFKLHQINTFIAGLDTGLSVLECQNLFRKMYENKGLDWNTQNLQMVLLEWVARN